jgi:hypothetical protein
MDLSPSSPQKTNPFSTRCVRPGAIAYCFPQGVDAETLLIRLRENHWRGEIVGPHGSGKSALLATLIPAIEHSGKRVARVELHDGQRRLPVAPARMPGLDASTVLVIDGFEQLSLANRFRVKRLTARRGAGLLVAAHASVGLPPLWTTSTDRELARRIVRRLLGESEPRIAPEEIDAAFSCHGGNLRETLFALYDLYESRRA